jgi:hypothetical protein
MSSSPWGRMLFADTTLHGRDTETAICQSLNGPIPEAEG